MLRRWLARPEIAILLGLLAVYAATTNTRGLYHASLHQGVVKALVENDTLYIRDYDPRVPLGGDVFIHDGHVYANKQPGSFFLGAVAYWLLRQSGVTYDGDFYLTAALVGVFTSGVLTTLTAVAVYRFARRARVDRLGDSASRSRSGSAAARCLTPARSITTCSRPRA